MGVAASVLQVYFLFGYRSGVVDLASSAPEKKHVCFEEEHLKDKDLVGQKLMAFKFEISHFFFPSFFSSLFFVFRGFLGEGFLVGLLWGAGGSGPAAVQSNSG